MPPQHVEIAETIAALKRTLRREKEAPTDQPISSATNRGNKLKRGASYVHAGSLPYPHGPDGYKQKIEHAGYTRYILERNPRRYNEYGDELEDSESDTEADADAEEENPYSGVRIEELLRPLRHPSDLAVHPTLSLPFLDSALPNLVRSTEETLRQERANLWRAKNLNRHFMGDESWMPLGSIEVPEDWDMFEPKPKLPSEQPANKRRKREVLDHTSQNGVNGHSYTVEEEDGSNKGSEIQNPNQSGPEGVQSAEADGLDREQRNFVQEDAQGTVDSPPATNGAHVDDNHDSPPAGNAGEPKLEHEEEPKEEPLEKAELGTDEQGDADDESLPQPSRRITRALAAEHNTSSAATPPLSPNSTTSSIDSSLLHADPFFLLPPNLGTNRRAIQDLSRLAMPVEEFMETRRLLMLFIQKQEESVRAYEGVLAKLTKAKRMREKLWEWCRTEGHVGELSDGEDWIDAEAWGLTPDDLKKGKDEEDLEGHEDTGRKGKRRRRD
ncbi:hypothetical protein A1O1_08134 [Capronia coronata CBS 617.96]|uniref:Transcriptional regulatory protein RXT2 N-terminal domain-containing protein n=1 Tax=Capronia coronata CBS 617.96 TaxID=1182541 RepID=W9XXH4_9EURO|nr:uncharacterized protein A1O1_08134 [Capronia coronata CBS 617.96]EXJ82065.1 hypothetical protein A1O1_08134 [Capronia coronata CBS 617.96]